jgi:hypothetical protein
VSARDEAPPILILLIIMSSSSSSSWRHSPAFYRARYASLGSTQPLLPTTTQATTRRDRSNAFASFLSRYPTILHASSKLRVRTLLAAGCGLLLAGFALSATTKRAPRVNRLLSSESRRPLLLLLRPMVQDVTLEGAQLSPPMLRRHRQHARDAPPPTRDAAPRTLSTGANEPRTSMLVPEPARPAAMASPPSSVLRTVASPRPRPTVVSIEPPLAVRRLALVHGWATRAILGGCLALAAIGVLDAIRRRRTARGPEDRRRRRSATGEYDDVDDSECSDDSEYDKEEEEESLDDELYRVLHSSDPVAIGYGSFTWSPASTIISVEPAASSSSWTGDYFDKFDV